MSALLILICLATCSAQNVFIRQYNLKCSKGEYTHAALKTFFALVFFLITTKDISFSLEILPYSIAFALFYVTATVGTVLAIRFGSLAITSLIIAYSLLIPTFYGLIFLKEGVSVEKIIGIVLLIVSIFLIRAESNESAEERKVSFKWLVWVIIAFVGNGFCSVFQNMQQKKFDGAQDGNFMVLALIIGVVALLVLTICFERKSFTEAFKKGIALAVAGGVCNGATNLLVMIITSMVATSVFFPVLSGGGLIVAFLISIFIYKESFVKRQLVGFAAGLASLVLLNL